MPDVILTRDRIARSCRLFLRVSVVGAVLSGCAVVVTPFVIASAVVDGISYASTGKSPADHLISGLTDQDCAWYRGFTDEPVCSPNEDDADDVAMAPVSPETVAIVTRMAEQGEANAQYQLAQLYRTGNAVEQDDSIAAKWYSLAARQGHASAEANLGAHYALGQGVAQDERIAVELYRRAAAKGHAFAQYNLGLSLSEGKGVAADETSAVKWYTLAAEQGHRSAQSNLGVMFVAGKGVEQDYVQAYMWWQIAADQGHEGARMNLAMVEKLMSAQQLLSAQTLGRTWRENREKT